MMRTLMDWMRLEGRASFVAAASLSTVDRLREKEFQRDPQADIPFRLTALMLAAFAGRDRLVRLLLASGADPNAGSEDDGTALMAAASFGHVDVVRTLLAAGADPSARDGQGFTALDMAVQMGHGDVTEVLRAAQGPCAEAPLPSAEP